MAVPRASRYSAAAKELSERLAAAGYHKSPSTLDTWAQVGMAPHPIRTSRGRKGSTSAYPAGALEQYIAVAKVMRPGRDVREAALILIGKGGLPTSEAFFHQALDWLFEGLGTTGDPLDAAEQMYADAQRDREFAPVARYLEDNARNANLSDAHTHRPLDPAAIMEGAMVNSMAAMFGRQIPTDEATSEVAAVYGFYGPGISEEERAARERFIEASHDDAFNFDVLRGTAAQVSPDRLQASVREFLSEADETPMPLFQILPNKFQRIIPVIGGLLFVTMEDLGGRSGSRGRPLHAHPATRFPARSWFWSLRGSQPIQIATGLQPSRREPPPPSPIGPRHGTERNA